MDWSFWTLLKGSVLVCEFRLLTDARECAPSARRVYCHPGNWNMPEYHERIHRWRTVDLVCGKLFLTVSVLKTVDISFNNLCLNDLEQRLRYFEMHVSQLNAYNYNILVLYCDYNDFSWGDRGDQGSNVGEETSVSHTVMISPATSGQASLLATKLNLLLQDPQQVPNIKNGQIAWKSGAISTISRQLKLQGRSPLFG